VFALAVIPSVVEMLGTTKDADGKARSTVTDLGRLYPNAIYLPLSNGLIRIADDRYILRLNKRCAIVAKIEKSPLHVRSRFGAYTGKTGKDFFVHSYTSKTLAQKLSSLPIM
jgi:hypothetical protein